MKNVVRGKRRCDHQNGCVTRPSYGFRGEGASRCSPHKEPGMENVVSERCDHPGCKKQPVFGLPGDATATRCDVHKEPGMVDVKNKRCEL